jgi:hypothetical protein
MKKYFIKKTLALSIISIFFIQIFYTALEPSLATAASVTDNVVVTLVVDAGLTITSPADVTMAPNIGIAANGSIGTSAWTVKTNSPTGFNFLLKASASPALVSGGNSFADYTETSAGVPEVWSVPATNKEFGYSAYGTDVLTATWGTGAGCGSAGAPLGTMKYVGFKTTDKTVVTTSTVTTPSGSTINVCYAAEQDSVYAASGTYTATITATATTL